MPPQPETPAFPHGLSQQDNSADGPSRCPKDAANKQRPTAGAVPLLLKKERSR